MPYRKIIKNGQTENVTSHGGVGFFMINANCVYASYKVVSAQPNKTRVKILNNMERIDDLIPFPPFLLTRRRLPLADQKLYRSISLIIKMVRSEERRVGKSNKHV